MVGNQKQRPVSKEEPQSRISEPLVIQDLPLERQSVSDANNIPDFFKGVSKNN